MKKILAVLLATSSVAVFADTFQDFNNNLYAQYSYTNTTVGTASAYSNNYGVGGTFQSKNDVWLNANAATANSHDGSGVTGNYGLLNIRAGYGFQFFGDDDSGFQVIPYVSFGDVNNAGYAWGVGVQPEYRLLSSLKVSLGMGIQGYDGNVNNSMTAAINGGNNCGCATVFGYNVNPEVQYDIAKTIMLSAGYNFVSTFNAQNSTAQNAFTAKVGYLF